MEKYLQFNKWQMLSIGWIVLVIILVWTYLIPEFEQTMHVYSQLQDQNQKMSAAKNWESRLGQLEKQEEKLEDYFSKIFVSLPENDQMSTIIDQVFREAKETNVKVTQMRPAERIQYETYEEIPISLQLQGSFHQIAQCISRIEQSKYLMKVEDAKIKHIEDLTTGLNVFVSIRVIILKNKSHNPDA